MGFFKLLCYNLIVFDSLYVYVRGGILLDLNFLYKNIEENEKAFKNKKNTIVCRIENNYGGMNAIYLKKILSCFKRLIRVKSKSLPLYIYLNCIAFGDEAVVVYLELAVYSLIQSGYKIIIC